MFDLKDWLVKGIVNGYKGGYFSLPHVTTMTANYVVSGLLTEADAANISAECDAWDAVNQPMNEDGPEEEMLPDEVIE